MKIIDDDLLAEFRAATQCQWCRKPTPYGCDPAHVMARGRSNGFRLDLRINLASLCRVCHSSAHQGNEPTRDDLIALIAARDGYLQDDLRTVLHRLRWAPPGTDPTEILSMLRKVG